jgi:ribosome-binding factor A
MTSRRVQKAAQAIREVVGMAILADLKDPRVQHVTVTYVEVTPDMRSAKVYVSVMGDETRQRLSLRGLQNAAGFLQTKVAKRIDTRYTPRLEFVLDLGVKKSIEISQILQEVLPPAEPGTGASEDSGSDDVVNADNVANADEATDANEIKDADSDELLEAGDNSDDPAEERP